MTVRGLVLGKFLPPHLGHVYLVEFAQRYVDRLAVVVGTLAREPIDGEQRVRWMRELFPDCDVVHLTDENPQDPSEHPDFWAIWRRSLERVLPYPVDVVFASEDYGPKLADVLGARFVPVDRARAAVPVSGTAVRRAPIEHFAFLPRPVRPYFAKRVCVFGPESTGKSTLTLDLARHFGAVAVPEYARTYLELTGGELAYDDLERIARGQAASEDALARNAERGLVVCDTDVLATTIWSDVFYGRCAPWITEQAERRDYDLYLLTDVDVPWVADVVRYLPDDRASFFARCRDALATRGRRFVEIRGSWEERFGAAVRAVEQVLAEPWTDRRSAR